MFIQEAVSKALKEGKVVRRKLKGVLEGNSKGITTVIMPTNSYACCIIKRTSVHGEKKPSELWNPTADDLTADDWEVINWPLE